MSVDTISFDSAVERLDEFLRSKTVHSVKSINQQMIHLCTDFHWETGEDQNDFANICSNFEKYCMITKKTSFGRKQFEEAWEKNFAVEDSLENAVAMVANKDIMLQEDSLPDFGTGISLEEENEQLKLEVLELKTRLKEIGKLVNPWV